MRMAWALYALTCLALLVTWSFDLSATEKSLEVAAALGLAALLSAIDTASAGSQHIADTPESKEAPLSSTNDR